MRVCSISISIHTYIHVYIYTCIHTCQPTNIHDFTFLDFSISGISRFPEIWKLQKCRNLEILESCVCNLYMFVGRQYDYLYKACMSMYICRHAYIQTCMNVYICVSL